MPDENLKPIPIPPRQRWRQFRVAYLPIFTFALLIVLIGWMWTRYVAPSSIIGEVETVRANIISGASGTIQELKVDRLQSVTNGQELAVVVMLDADQMRVELADAEADLRLMKARMDLDKTRNLDAYSRLREEFLTEQLKLEIARINLVQVEGEFDRTKKLFDSQSIARGTGVTRNDFGYDVALRDRDLWRAEVAAREKVVTELQTAVEHMQAAGAAQIDPVDAAVERAIIARRESLERLQKSVVLRSPIDGFISAVNHLPGEKVTSGQAVVVVSAEKSDRIIAWVRQPITTRPQVGDIVQVRRMTIGQPLFEATIVRVGKQLEQINPTAVSLTESIERAEFGLPLIVKVADAIDLIPGEAVQLRIVKNAGSAAAN